MEWGSKTIRGEDLMGTAGSFDFFENYVESVTSRQPELYAETARLCNEQFSAFARLHGRKPVVIDVGCAGVLSYDLDLIEHLYIIDLFDPPRGFVCPPRTTWVKGDILDPTLGLPVKGDVAMFHSVLHHLGTPTTRQIQQNVGLAFAHSMAMLNPEGFAFIIESTCSNFLAAAQDVLRLPVQFALRVLLRFASVRMLSLDEILRVIGGLGLEVQRYPFRKPSHIAVIYFKLPSWAYPVEISCLKIKRRPLAVSRAA
jgi:hypothetical protein